MKQHKARKHPIEQDRCVAGPDAPALARTALDLLLKVPWLETQGSVLMSFPSIVRPVRLRITSLRGG